MYSEQKHFKNQNGWRLTLVGYIHSVVYDLNTEHGTIDRVPDPCSDQRGGVEPETSALQVQRPNCNDVFGQTNQTELED